MQFFRRALLILLAVALIAWISSFSSDTAVQSVEKSQGVAAFALSIFHKGFDFLPLDEREALIERVQAPIRKLAHGAEFFLLGAVLTLLFAELGRRRPWMWGWVAAVLVAALDETHQLMVAGRSASLLDVGIDAAGALVGAALTGWILFKWRRRRRKGCKIS